MRFADIRDGLSQTFIAGERSLDLDYTTWVGAPPGDECSPGLVVGTANFVPNSPQADAHNFGSRHATARTFWLGDGSVQSGVAVHRCEGAYQALMHPSRRRGGRAEAVLGE